MTEWYTYWSDEALTLRIEFWRSMAFLHLDIAKPVTGTKRMRGIWPSVTKMLGAIGHRFVYVLMREENKKLFRYVRLFGFEERKRKHGYILARSSTWAIS